MNKNISKIKDGILIGIGILFVMGAANAWTGLQAADGDTLTHTKWNELIDKVDGIFTDGTGRVGIGTETPTRDLSIVSSTPGISFIDTDDNSDNVVSSYQGGQLRLDADYNNEVAGGGVYFRNNGDDIDMVVKDDGNVGIGTTAPSNKLQVEGRIRGSRIGIGTNTDSYLAEFHGGSTNDGLRIRSADGNKDIFSAQDHSGANRLTVKGSGKVGIGTSSPNSTLTIGNGRNLSNEYVKIDFETFSSPASSDCNETNEEGRMIFAGGTKRLYICDGSNGWKYATFAN